MTKRTCSACRIKYQRRVPIRALPEPTVHPETGAGTRHWSPRTQAARASVIRHSQRWTRAATAEHHQLGAGLAGALAATALAAGAVWNLTNSGSSSPEPDASTATAAARLDRLATSAKTAPASRTLSDRRENLNAFMMFSNGGTQQSKRPGSFRSPGLVSLGSEGVNRL